MKLLADKGQRGDKSRIEGFSDNVFGIALTLLVLNIKVPTLPTGDQPMLLLQQLGAEWPAYLTYVISFLTVLLMWINHNVMFERVRKPDHALMFLNGMMLLPVTLVPFPTSLLSEYLIHPQARYAAGLFAGSFVMIAGLYYLVWVHITRLNKSQGVTEDPVHLRRSTRKVRLVFALYVGAFCIAFIYPLACIAACFMISIYLALPVMQNAPD